MKASGQCNKYPRINGQSNKYSRINKYPRRINSIGGYSILFIVRTGEWKGRCWMIEAVCFAAPILHLSVLHLPVVSLSRLCRIVRV